MSEPNANIKVGFFVLSGLILLIFSILLFSGGTQVFGSKYTVYSKFKSTQGLAGGSIVSLAGVEVGNVKNIVFTDNMDLVVEMRIRDSFKNSITDQAIASIRTQGALGDRYVYISPGMAQGEVIQDKGFLIADTQPDFFEAIAQKASEVSITDTIRELNQLLHNLNANGRSGLLMENFVNASQNVSKLMSEPSIRESFIHLRNILRKIDKGDGTLAQLINDPVLHNRLMTILGDSPRNKYLKPLIREAIKQNEQDGGKPTR